MIIVKISGGLGNQLYQYALYRKFQLMGVEAKMSLCYFRDTNMMKRIPRHSEKYLLSDIFADVQEKFSTADEDSFFCKFSSSFILRFIAKKGFIPNLIIEDVRYNKSCFSSKVLKYKNAFLDGYWQSYKYSADIMDVLRKELVFKNKPFGQNADIVKAIESNNSVSIHVRRGDYVNSEYVLLGREYYDKALAIVQQNIDNPHFFVFSDDIEWCKENLGIQGTFITWNKGTNSYVDMQLMSLCKVNVVANSTFSIWAALLNNNPNPIVIRPSKYSKAAVQKIERWPENWIEVEFGTRN